MPTKPFLPLLILVMLCDVSVEPALAADEDKRPRPRLQILNGTNQPVDLFWLRSETERVPNGSIKPHDNTIITTTIGHRFVIVRRDDKSETIVTSEVPIQAFQVGGVPEFYT